MLDFLAIPAEVVVALIALAVIALVYAVARRRALVHGHWAVLVAILDDGHWRAGIVRPSVDQVEWFSLRGPMIRPKYVWPRTQFDLGAPHEVSRPIEAVNDPVELDCVLGGAPFTLALSRFDYTALRSWSESAPPGLMRPAP